VAEQEKMFTMPVFLSESVSSVGKAEIRSGCHATFPCVLPHLVSFRFVSVRSVGQKSGAGFCWFIFHAMPGIHWMSGPPPPMPVEMAFSLSTNTHTTIEVQI